MSSKKELRSQILKRRNNLSDLEIQKRSELINKKLVELIQGPVAMFYPIKNEVDLRPLFKGGVALPKVDKVMQMYEFNGKVIIGAFGIPEPTGKRTEVRTVIVPGAVFDLSGNRIGYGGGYYDRYLTGDHLKIGVCFDFQVVDQLQTEPHDVALNILVTDKRVIFFKE